jgi:hypothetical protein
MGGYTPARTKIKRIPQAGSWCSDAEVLTNFWTLSYLFRRYVRFAAININFIFFRFLKFFKKNERMAVLYEALGKGKNACYYSTDFSTTE